MFASLEHSPNDPALAANSYRRVVFLIQNFFSHVCMQHDSSV